MENTRFFVAEHDNEVLILTPVRDLGSFAEDEVRDEWDRVMEHIKQDQTRHVILDLSQLHHFGSVMLEMLVVLWKRLSAEKGRLAICSVSTVGREILHIAKFDTIWPICPNREQALQVMRK